MPYAHEEVYENDKKLVEMIYRTQSLARSAFAPLRDTIWRRDFLLYNSRHDPKMFGQYANQYPLESAVFVPATYQQIESSASDIGQGVLANEPGFGLASVIGSSEYEEKSKYVDWSRRVMTMLWTQLVKHVGLRKYAVPWARYCETYGTLWLGVEWYKLIGVKWQLTRKADGEWGMVPEHGKITEDRIKVSPRSVFAILPDPRATSVNDAIDGRPMRFLQERNPMAVDDFLAYIESTPKLGWEFSGPTEARAEVEKHMGRLTADDDIERDLQREIGHMGAGSTNPPSDAEDKRIVAVTKHWEKDRVIWTVGNGADARLCLRLIGDKYPYINAGIPFVAMRTHPIVGELFGVSEAEAGAGLNHQANVLVNMRNAGLVRSLNNLTFVNTMSGLTADQLRSQPGGAFNVPYGVDMEAIVKMVEWPDVTASVYREVDFILQQHQLTMGRSNFSQGFSSPGFNETARGIGMMMGANQGRSNAKIQAMCEDIATLAQMMLRIDQRFMKAEQLWRVTGEDGTPDWLEVSREMLARDYEITFDTRPQAANKQVQAQQFIQGLQVCAQWPELNKAEAITVLADLLDIQNPHKFCNVQSSDAHGENMHFLGSTPPDLGPVGPGDDHKYHLRIHQQLTPEQIKARGDAGHLNYLNHVRGHLGYLNGITPAQRDGRMVQEPQGGPMIPPPQGGQPGPQVAPQGPPSGPPAGPPSPPGGMPGGY